MIRVAICVDKDGGLYFNNRRQSRDRILIQDLINSIGNELLFISEYSLPLFKGHEDKVKVCEKPLADCPDGGICFVELSNIGEHKDRIKEIIIYNWGEKYPSDIKLDFSPEENGLSLVNLYEFEGSSHKKITKGVYR